jgi:hypothetical protein
VQRTVQSYTAHADADRIRDRIIELNGVNKLDAEIAATLNKEGLRTAHGPDFSGNMIHVLRKRWGIKTVKITTAQKQTHSAGRMEVTRFRVPLKFLVLRRRPFSTGFARDGCRDSTSPRVCPGRFFCRRTGQLSSKHARDTPADQEERGHEVFESPNTPTHSAKDRLVVTISEVFS